MLLSKRPTSAGLRVTVILGSALMLAACGGGGNNHSESASDRSTGSVSTSTTTTRAVNTTTTTAAINQASDIGRLLLDDSTANEVCQAALNKTAGPGLPSTTTTTEGNTPSIQSSGPSASVVGNVSISNGGLAILTCSPGSGDDFVVGFNLYTRQVEWKVVAHFLNFGVGTDHLFGVNETTTPASGLNSGTTSYSLTAISLVNGSTSWTSALPINPNSSDDYNDNSLNLTEGPSGDPSHPEDVLVNYDGTAAFDSSTGQLMWNIDNQYNTQASGSYTGFGVVEVGEYNGRCCGGGITDKSASTGNQVWTFSYPNICNEGDDFYNASWGDQVLGNTEWLFGSDCYMSYNYQTGQVLSSAAIPSSWTNNNASYIATPNYALVADGTTLALYKLSNLTTALWSIPGNSVTPLAIGTTRVLVQGATQPLFLSMTNGSTVGSLTNVSLQANTVTNGLLVQDDSVLDVG